MKEVTVYLVVSGDAWNGSFSISRKVLSYYLCVYKRVSAGRAHMFFKAFLLETRRRIVLYFIS